MRSKLLSFKSLTLFCIATMLLSMTGFAQDNKRATVKELKSQEPNAKVTIEATNVAPSEQNPTQEPQVQTAKIDVSKKPFSVEKEVEIKDENTPYYTVAQMPEYVDGKSELPLYVYQEAKYPAEAMKDKAEGVVIVQIIVEKDGTIKEEPQVIASVHQLLDKEAVRVAKTLKFNPGKENGETVRCYYEIPVPFLFNKK